MVSNKGNTVPNQVIITDEENRFFQSYDSIIAVIPFNKKKGFKKFAKGRKQPDILPQAYLDIKKWDYSRTTSTYRNIFLNEDKSETEDKIESCEYMLINLNKD